MQGPQVRAQDKASSIAVPGPTTILELRTGKLAAFGPVQSAIVKDIRQGQLYVSQDGIGEDEHDLTFHGGKDKVVHQYNADHYPGWQKEHPNAADRFTFGSFGENLVTKGWTEDTICAGDVVSIGHFDNRVTPDAHDGRRIGCLLQVSIPRQPCFKLNQRFGIKNFAPTTHATNRTGWYYRLLEEGWIEQGMQMQIIKRPNPQWPISRLHQFVHRDKKDLFAIETLRDLPFLGDECADVFRERWRALETAKAKAAEKWRTYRLLKKARETPRIASFTFEAVDVEEKPQRVRPGAHVSIRLPNGLQRAYSVVAGDTNRFQLGVARDESSRGGSIYMHDQLEEGAHIDAGTITPSLLPSPMASRHLLIAGGIGITAFPVMLARMVQTNQDVELHYCVRSTDEIAFGTLLEAYSDKVKTYDASKKQRLDIIGLLRNRRMIEAVQQAAKEAGMSEDEVHFEAFKVEIGGDPFSVEVRRGGEKKKKKQLAVPGDQSLLEVLRANGLDVGSSCEAGSCGTCRVQVICGRVSHVGTGLTEQEKETEMLSCVSRGIGHIEIAVDEAW